MNATKSIKINLCMYAYDGTAERHNGGYGGYPHPRDIPDPPHTVDRAWIPQTMGDSIWKLYEFETTQQRDAFLADPPGVYKEAHLDTPDQDFYSHWLDADYRKARTDEKNNEILASNDLAYVLKMEWSMGNGQCPVCEGLKPGFHALGGSGYQDEQGNWQHKSWYETNPELRDFEKHKEGCALEKRIHQLRRAKTL